MLSNNSRPFGREYVVLFFEVFAVRDVFDAATAVPLSLRPDLLDLLPKGVTNQ